VRHPFFDDDSPRPLSPEEAVRRGKLIINLPISGLIAGLPIIGALTGNIAIALSGLALGFVLGWLWWSFSVPRWREWAKRGGADPDRTQRLAEIGRGPLVWTRGSIFEKTEFRPRKKS
jgi:hypothetical protein